MCWETQVLMCHQVCYIFREAWPKLCLRWIYIPYKLSVFPVNVNLTHQVCLVISCPVCHQLMTLTSTIDRPIQVFLIFHCQTVIENQLASLVIRVLLMSFRVNKMDTTSCHEDSINLV
jgi:hypothetical protein